MRRNNAGHSDQSIRISFVLWAQVLADRTVRLGEFNRHARELHGKRKTRFGIVGDRARKSRVGHGVSRCKPGNAGEKSIQRALYQITRCDVEHILDAKQRRMDVGIHT